MGARMGSFSLVLPPPFLPPPPPPPPARGGSAAGTGMRAERPSALKGDSEETERRRERSEAATPSAADESAAEAAAPGTTLCATAVREKTSPLGAVSSMPSRRRLAAGTAAAELWGAPPGSACELRPPPSCGSGSDGLERAVAGSSVPRKAAGLWGPLRADARSVVCSPGRKKADAAAALAAAAAAASGVSDPKRACRRRMRKASGPAFSATASAAAAAFTSAAFAGTHGSRPKNSDAVTSGSGLPSRRR